MIKNSLCIEPILTDLDFYDRIKVAAELGFDAIEFWNPDGRDVTKIGRLAEQNNIAVAACTAKNPWDNRMNLSASAVKKNIVESLKLAKEMGCKSVIVLAGDVECKADTQKNILIENLKRVVDAAEKEGITIILEALNSLVDHKGYYLDSSYLGFEIVKSVGSDSVKLLYDIYHMQIMEGSIIENITKNIEFIGHFHSAGVPGRHEIFNGESNYKIILKAIEKAGYDRYFGHEYWPSYDHMKSLKDVMEYVKG